MVCPLCRTDAVALRIGRRHSTVASDNRSGFVRWAHCVPHIPPPGRSAAAIPYVADGQPDHSALQKILGRVATAPLLRGASKRRFGGWTFRKQQADPMRRTPGAKALSIIRGILVGAPLEAAP